MEKNKKKNLTDTHNWSRKSCNNNNNNKTHSIFIKNKIRFADTHARPCAIMKQTKMGSDILNYELERQGFPKNTRKM